MPHSTYLILHAGDKMAGGMMALADGAMPPAWTGYVGVDDVDAKAHAAKAAGGAIFREPSEIPGVGRFAVVGDPHGAAFILFKPNSDATPEDLSQKPGHVGWHELHAGDSEADFAFYAALFGWTKTEAMEMPGMGVYQMFSTGGPTVGGMMTARAPMRPHWLFYFNVEAIDAAKARVEAGGGKILNGPMEVPGGQWVAQCMDPQGAMFAMVAPGR